MTTTKLKTPTAGKAAFDVFLSYSRRDKEIAVRLEEALESYRIPRDLRSEIGTLNVFRDEADITAGDDYFRKIEQTIQGSSKLVVICSPDARKSQYVADEIRRFIKIHGAEHIIPVMVRGKANNETTNEEEMAFPEPLCENRMPLAANFLGHESYKGSLQKGPYRSAFFSVLAGINNIERRRLEQIDERIRTRRRLIAIGTASLIILALSIALVFALRSRAEAVRQQQIAEEQTRIATRERENAEAAQRKLQLEYLEAIGETSVNQVLRQDAVAGGIRLTDEAAWLPLMTAGALPFTAGREYGAGRVLAAAHDGVLIGKSERFFKQAFEWLRGPRGTKEILVASGHCEWVSLPGRNFQLPQRLLDDGYAAKDLPGAIDEASLNGAGVLVIGNAWGNLTDAEIQAVEKFVSNGGGLFLAGLGWSWKQDSPRLAAGRGCVAKSQGQDVADLATYPMNRLAAPYKVAWTENFQFR